MAKDDYNVLVYKILVYLYACFKRRIVFDRKVFMKTIGRVNEDYLADVLRLMKTQGLIDGYSCTKAWSGTYIMTSDFEDLEITAEGINYLQENDRMHKVGEFLVENADAIAGLIKKILP